MSSVRLLIVEKNGTIKESVLKTWNEEELYKKAGFKSEQGFKLATTWKVDDINKKSYTINVYGKTDGRATQENKYEFPPPIDETLFFGSCLIVNMCNDKPVSLTTAEWTCIYEKLYGGFESLGECSMTNFTNDIIVFSNSVSLFCYKSIAADIDPLFFSFH